MIELEFNLIHEYGRRRYYPANPEAYLMLQKIKRKTLRPDEIQKLIDEKWPIKVNVINDRPHYKSAN